LPEAALANTIGLADRLLGVLQRTLFSGDANVYGHTVLTDTASRIGILRSRVEEVLSSDECCSDAEHFGFRGLHQRDRPAWSDK
jgi:predicted DsbA family dithiol-disulfide isomerase